MPITLKIVSRGEWGAKDQLLRHMVALRHPVDYVIFTYTDTSACKDNDECVKFLLDLRSRQMREDKLPDIAYNFLMGKDATVYEGRGWLYASHKLDDAHEKFTPRSVVIAYIGRSFGKKDEPSLAVYRHKQKFIKKGVELGYINKDHSLIVHKKDLIKK